MRRVLIVLTLVAATAIPALAQEAGWIGVNVTEQKDRGVLVRGVEANSPAAQAGLKANDVIIQYNKQDVAGVLQLSRLVQETPVGRTVEVKVLRDNSEQTFQVTTGATPDINSRYRIQVPNLSILQDHVTRSFPDILVMRSGSRSGIQVESLTPQLREFFGVKSDEGVLVASVEAGSAAEKAGLKAGDVITAVDGKRVSTPADLTSRLGTAGVTLKVVRDKQEREIKIEDSRTNPARRINA